MTHVSRILIVDDEAELRSMVRRGLESEGHLVLEAGDGPSGLAQAIASDIDLVILDLGLPTLAGEEVLGQLANVSPDLPIIVLTAKDGIDDRVGALDRGAQDYLVKPFALAELMARIRLRLGPRSEPRTASRDGVTPTSLAHGRVRLDLVNHSAEVAGEQTLLTPQEFALAKQFLLRPEEVLSRTELLRSVWGLEQAPRRSNLVDVGVAALRRRLGADAVETVRGAGYRFLG